MKNHKPGLTDDAPSRGPRSWPVEAVSGSSPHVYNSRNTHRRKRERKTRQTEREKGTGKPKPANTIEVMIINNDGRGGTVGLQANSELPVLQGPLYLSLLPLGSIDHEEKTEQYCSDNPLGAMAALIRRANAGRDACTGIANESKN